MSYWLQVNNPKTGLRLPDKNLNISICNEYERNKPVSKLYTKHQSRSKQPMWHTGQNTANELGQQSDIDSQQITDAAM